MTFQNKQEVECLGIVGYWLDPVCPRPGFKCLGNEIPTGSNQKLCFFFPHLQKSGFASASYSHKAQFVGGIPNSTRV
jgi:hypothetical protein